MVSPGFIDLLSYEPNPYGVWFKIGDGVTTNIGMHGMNEVAGDFFAMYEGENRAPGALRRRLRRPVDAHPRGHQDPHRPRPAQIADLAQRVEEGFAAGWIGVEFEPEYTPWVTSDEINAMAATAKAHDMPVFFHVRYSSPDEPGKDNATAIAEVLERGPHHRRLGARRPHHLAPVAPTPCPRRSTR